jgi:hypothetical protein
VVPGAGRQHGAVDYAQAQAAFLYPAPEGQTPPRVPATDARRLRDALEPVATVHFWCARTNQLLTELGLNFLTGYVWSRAAPLGQPTAPVVVAALGVFEPGLIRGLYEEALATARRDDVLAARERGTVETLEQLFGGEDVTGAVEALRRAVDALSPDVAGRPLFAGLLSLDEPETPLGRLWHAATTLREYRGDVHQAANVAAGLSAVQMNLMTEYWIGWAPTSYAGTRGWSPEAMAAGDADLVARGLAADGRLTAAGQDLRDDVEARTDAAMAPALAAIGGDLDGLAAQLDSWSAAIIAAGAAPADPYKRVSG